MTATLPDRPAVTGSAGGGVAARRAVARWAWRLLRREWRQQALAVALLALAVAAAAFTVPAAYNVASLPGPQFGAANYLLQFAGSDRKALAADLVAARQAFGTVEVISRQFVPIPGSAQTIEYRAESPQGPYSGPMLALDQGHYPAGAGQVAVTGQLAQTLQLRVGSALSLDGHRRVVSGIIEDPSDLGDQFALVTPASAGPPQTVTVLLDASSASFSAFLASFRGPLVWQARGPSTQGAVAGVTLGLVTVLLLLVSLVAAAGFAVFAARRQRQLGMLAAIGATRKQLRMVTVAGGAIVGVIAAAVGTVAGLAAWIAVAPDLETFAGHRIDRFTIPWSLVILAMVLAVATATGAAWWPAWVAARLPVTQALSARPPRPKPARRPALLAGLLIAAGVTCLALASQSRPPLIIAGALAMALGILFISPLAIMALGAAGQRAPVTMRLALRDLARHQARSGAGLAAISLAAGITVAIIISSAADKAAANAGNLPGNQVAAWIGQPEAADSLVPVRTPAQLAILGAAVQQIAGMLPRATVISLDMPVDPADKPQPDSQGGGAEQPVANLAVPQNPAAGRSGTYSSIPLYAANPDVLRYLGINPATVSVNTDILTVYAGSLGVASHSTFATVNHEQRIQAPGYTSAPTSLITLVDLYRLHWRQVQAGWLISSSKPLTTAQLAAAREVAAADGLVLETRNTQASLATISAAATAAGALLALGVLAMTVGLIRTEAAGDLRTLTAAGATSTTRRSLTATTAGALALLGAVTGTAGAYLALAAAHRSDLAALGHVPVLYLTITLVGVPAVAALTGWILAGRQPSAIARRVLE